MASSNQNAVALVDQWPQWPTFGAVISGPPGSGKSHLATVWQHVAGAESVSTRELQVEQVPHLLLAPALVIEDVDAGCLNERALFHALNMARETGRSILLTATKPPEGWGIQLPDLLTRIRLFPHAAILPPDDALLRGVLVKLFADRQIAVDEALVSYLVNRMPRSLAAARTIVAAIDSRALEEGADVTRAFAGRILGELEGISHFQADEL